MNISAKRCWRQSYGLALAFSCWASIGHTETLVEQGDLPPSTDAYLEPRQDDRALVSALSRILAINDDQVYGLAEAPMSIISYQDFHCVHCRRLIPILTKLVYSSNGSVNWVYRHFPLSADAGDWQLSSAADCVALTAGEPVFWSFIRSLYALPWSAAANDTKRIQLAAKANGLDAADLARCGGNESEVVDNIRRVRADAVAIGIKATPSLILVHRPSGQWRLVEGNVSQKSLQLTLKALENQ